MKLSNVIFFLMVLFLFDVSIFGQTENNLEQNNSGRALLVGSSTVSGGIYGITFQSIFGITGDRALVGTYFLSTAAGFATSFGMTHKKNVPLPAATLAVGGQILGYQDGLALSLLLSPNIEDGPDAKILTSLGMASSIGQTILGYRYVQKNNLTLGRTSLINMGHLWGLGYGVGWSYLFGFPERSGEGAIRGTGATIFLSSMAGMAAGAFLMSDKHYTNGDAIVIQTMGMIGGYLPIGFVQLADPDDSKLYTATSMFTSMAGLGFGLHQLPKQNFTSSQGTLISLGAAVSGLFALGTTYVIGNNNTESSTYLITSGLGTVAGFVGMYKLFSNKKKEEENNKVGYHFQIYPQHFLNKTNKEMTKQNLENAMPLASLNLTF
ncbi:MAG: hypothetical protein ACPG5B_13575 [Chitinophagales bacterium]